MKSGQQTAVQAYIAGDIAPEKQSRNAQRSCFVHLSDYLDSRSLRCHLSAPLPSFKRASGRQRHCRSLRRTSCQASRKSLPFPLPPLAPMRSFSSEHFVLQQSVSNDPRQPVQGAHDQSSRPKLDRRLLSPRHRSSSYYLGCDCTILRIRNKIDPSQPLPLTPAAPSPSLHQHHMKM